MQGTFGRTLCTAGLGFVAAVMSGCVDMTLPDLSGGDGYQVGTTTPGTCSPPPFHPSGAYSPSSGSVALSNDQTLVYVVDTDNGVLAVVNASTLGVVNRLKVGTRPERVAVGPDDTVYVSNRGDRSVSVITRGATVEAARIPVGVEPVGVAVSPSGDTLYVVNSTTLTDPSTGSLMAFNLPARTLRWELPVGEEPRGIALFGTGTVAVTLYKQGVIALVDPSGPRLIAPAGIAPLLVENFGSEATAADTVPPSGPFTGLIETFNLHGMATIAVTPDGTSAWAPFLLSSNSVIPDRSSGGVVVLADGGVVSADPDAGLSCTGGGAKYYGGAVDCGPGDPNPPQGPVVTPGVIGFQPDGTPIAVDNASNRFSALSFSGVQEPLAIALDPTGTVAAVVGRGSDSVALIPTGWTPSFACPATGCCVGGTFLVPGQVQVGEGANGVALTRDGRAFVYAQFDHLLTEVQGIPSGYPELGRTQVVAQDTLPADQAAGRRLFFSAVDSRMTDPTVGISCASCHLEGREDGHVWHFLDGPRQTPAVVGRKLDQTAPYHWSGVLPTMHAFMAMTITTRMGGTGLADADEANLLSFLLNAPAPENPFQGLPLNASQQRGAQLFASSGCAACHAGTAYTSDGFAEVGTQSTDIANPDDFSQMPYGLNIPSLLGVSRSAPYLHDGSKPTLKARILMNKDLNKHGLTASLTDADVDDLVAFLQTL